MRKDLDLMEYSSDAPAQAAYVTNADLRSNADIDNEDMADITDWTDEDYGGTSTQVTFDGKSCMKLDSGSVGNDAARLKTYGTSVGVAFSFNCYFDAIGTAAQADGLRLWIGNGTYLMQMKFCSDGLFISDHLGTPQEVGTDLVVQDVWQEWTFNFNWTTGTVDVYLDKILKASGVDFAQTSASYNKQIRINQQGDTTANRISYVDWEKTGNGLYSFQSYSESTIKTQGSYSLKGIAAITDSLNKTLTKTISPTIDLSGLSKIKFDMRTSRTGSNIKVSLHNSGVYGIDFLTGGTASGSAGVSNPEYAVDGNEATYVRWSGVALPTSWIYDQGAGVTKKSRKLRIKPYWDASGAYVNAFTWNGSNNGSDYTEIYAGNCANADQWNEFTFANSTAYRYHKLTVTSKFGTGSVDSIILEIEGMEMTSNVGTIEHTHNQTADAFEEVIVPLQNVINANKNAIDSIIITIVNADAGNIFYLDNAFGIYVPQTIMIG